MKKDENIIASSSIEMNNKNNSDIESITTFFKKMGIDLHKIKSEGINPYDYIPYRSLIGMMAESRPIDLRLNTIYLMFNHIKEYAIDACDTEIDKNLITEADFILINLIKNFYDKRFGNLIFDRKINNDLRFLTLWASESTEYVFLSLFYYSYINKTSLYFRKWVEENKYDIPKYQLEKLYFNIQLLSQKMACQCQEKYYSILASLVNDKTVSLIIDQDKMKYIKPINDLNPQFFEQNKPLSIFFTNNEIFEELSLEIISKMTAQQLQFIMKKKEHLRKDIYELLRADVPFEKIEKILFYQELLQKNHLKKRLLKK